MARGTQSIRLHAATHLPQGQDPLILPDHVIWPTHPIVLPLSGFGDYSPYATQDILPPPDKWNTTIDTTRRNNFKLSFTGTGTGSLIWPLECGPGSYTLWFDAGYGAGYGTVTAYLAGAYGPNAFLPFVPSGDWILQSAWNLNNGGAATYKPILYRTQDEALNTGGNAAGIGWAIFAADGSEGVSTLYQKSTSISSSGVLNGGPGYFFFRLDVTQTFEVSEAIIQYNEP